jgi:hypothetical protein
MAGRNGKHRPPRPKLSIDAPGASAEEGAAIAAALEQFLVDTAPPPQRAEVSRWQRAALAEGVAARRIEPGSWGPDPSG